MRRHRVLWSLEVSRPPEIKSMKLIFASLFKMRASPQITAAHHCNEPNMLESQPMLDVGNIIIIIICPASVPMTCRSLKFSELRESGACKNEFRKFH